VKSRGSQCNETLLVRAAVGPTTGQKARSSVCCEKLGTTGKTGTRNKSVL